MDPNGPKSNMHSLFSIENAPSIIVFNEPSQFSDSHYLSYYPWVVEVKVQCSLEALQLAIYKIILPAEMKWDTNQNIVVLIS